MFSRRFWYYVAQKIRPFFNIDMNGKKISGLPVSGYPTEDNEAATKKYVDNSVVFPAPNYDSGFISIANNITTDFAHNLDTKNLLVQIFIKTPGSVYHTLWGSINSVIHSGWIHDYNTIKIANHWGVTKEFRLLLWKF